MVRLFGSMSHCYVSITRGASPIYSLGNVAECKGVLAGWHFGEQQHHEQPYSQVVLKIRSLTGGVSGIARFVWQENM
jgi:hypothetical protein